MTQLPMTTHDKSQKVIPSSAPISDETILKITKEITVKFIETGRVTPVNFSENFQEIYTTIKKCIQKHE